MELESIYTGCVSSSSRKVEREIKGKRKEIGRETKVGAR